MRGSVVKCSVGRGESGVKFGGNIWVLNWWKSKDWGKTVYAIWWEKILETIYSTFFVFLMRIFVNCICLACIVVILCVFVVPYVYLFYYVCIAVLTLDARQLARSQYPEGPATGHLDTGFSWFPCVYKWMLRWFPSFQVATTCLSCSPPDLNFLVIFFFIFVYM